jgi:hypothetical protein
MKRVNLINDLISAGCVRKRRSKKHFTLMNLRKGIKAPIPDVPIVPDSLCDLIKKRLRLS